ncbi:hypothetical protein JXB28_00580 [Candidatus Woesearchaeota archaeon]|nr:hypothetical protein [Candidatus Woesearchaeota archaeon]
MTSMTTAGKNFLLVSILLLFSLSLLSGCKPQTEPTVITDPLFNQTINENLDEIVKPAEKPSFEEFYFEYSPRNEAEYEIAEDDIFTLSMGDFKSTGISFLGVMLGDSYESVIERLGIPDQMFTPADKSYSNLDYKKKIGIGSTAPGLTIHVENNTVTRITVKPSFQKYLQGNTSIGTAKETIYYLLDVPDYQDFTSNLRVFHYVEKGVEIYLKADKIDRISFFMPREFKGVQYRSVSEQTSQGILTNTTEAVPIE